MHEKILFQGSIPFFYAWEIQEKNLILKTEVLYQLDNTLLLGLKPSGLEATILQ